MRFIFDTGANTLVITHESAVMLGIVPDALEYSVTVSTANGQTTAAPVMLDKVTIGTITQSRVRALITRPQILRFLERLSSYEVKGDRLTLRD
jgi:aspartyl protease family protein